MSSNTDRLSLSLFKVNLYIYLPIIPRILTIGPRIELNNNRSVSQSSRGSFVSFVSIKLSSMMPIANVCCLDFKLLPTYSCTTNYNSCANSKCDMEIRCNESLIHCNNKYTYLPSSVRLLGGVKSTMLDTLQNQLDFIKKLNGLQGKCCIL